MAPHSSTLAWKVPWTEERGRLQSMGVTKRQTRLSDFTFTFHFDSSEKEMATHSSVLAWRIPGTGEPGGLQFLGRKVMTNLGSILKSRVITLPTKVHPVKAMVFPVVMYGCVHRSVMSDSL